MVNHGFHGWGGIIWGLGGDGWGAERLKTAGGPWGRQPPGGKKKLKQTQDKYKTSCKTITRYIASIGLRRGSSTKPEKKYTL